MFDVKYKEINWAEKKLRLETGRFARQADGAVLVTYGNTTVLSSDGTSLFVSGISNSGNFYSSSGTGNTGLGEDANWNSTGNTHLKLVGNNNCMIFRVTFFNYCRARSKRRPRRPSSILGRTTAPLR